MMDPQDEPTVRDEDEEPPTGEQRGPAQWVPKGALSRFLVHGTAWAFAVQILGTADPSLRQRFGDFKRSLVEQIAAKNEALQAGLKS